MKNVVIIGASHAASEAVASLRRLGWQDKITLIGEEEVLPYQRPPLSKGYLKGDIGIAELALRKDDFYQKFNVDLLLGQRATLINREEKSLHLEGGQTVAYDYLILATGTRARQLPIAGADLPQIHYLRTLADVNAIKNTLKPNARLLIVGAGYIGLEVAASAVVQGVEVTVIEAMDRVLARVTGPEISDFYESVHREKGVDIRLNASLVKFEKQDNHAVAELANGEKLSFDCAIVGIGVIPNTELAEQAGLACDNGIVVDQYTQTADKAIFAVGDCSNHPNLLYDRRVRLESVPNAVAQAKTAASVICGCAEPYNQLPWFWSDQYDIKLQTAGLLQGYDKTLVEGDVGAQTFTVSYFKSGQKIALDAINSPAAFMQARKFLSQ
jgi:3-phenylpropionate/trans-cinnamate dioxygenase ferredoxin reductase subunit